MCSIVIVGGNKSNADNGGMDLDRETVVSALRVDLDDFGSDKVVETWTIQREA